MSFTSSNHNKNDNNNTNNTEFNSNTNDEQQQQQQQALSASLQVPIVDTDGFTMLASGIVQENEEEEEEEKGKEKALQQQKPHEDSELNPSSLLAPSLPPLPLPTLEPNIDTNNTTSISFDNNGHVGGGDHDEDDHDDNYLDDDDLDDNDLDDIGCGEQQYSFYAIRRGKFGLKSCIFLNWNDCQKFIQNNTKDDDDNENDEEDIIYAPFHHFEDAITYLHTGEEDEDDDDNDNNYDTTEQDVNNNTNSNSTSNTTSIKRKLNNQTIQLISPFSHPTTSKSTLYNRRGLRIKAEANPNRKPTKAWENMYQRFVKYVQEKGTIDVDVNSKDDADLLRWTRQQQHEYRYMKEGKASSMFQMKIDKLQSIGFEFKYVSMEERLAALLQFKQKHGNYKVTESHPTLGKWVSQQKKAAKKFVDEGDANAFFNGKVKELLSLGFKVAYVDNTGCGGGKRKKNKNATTTSTDDDTTTKTTQDSTFNNGSAESVNDAGCSGDDDVHEVVDVEADSNIMDPSASIIIESINNTNTFVRPDEDKKWMKNYNDLVEYKEKHGTCEVPPSLHNSLSYWVTQQHKEYQKVQEGKPSRLTLQKVQQLTDLGFKFRHVAKSYTWKERIQQLKEYKAKHGHVRVPKSHPELGVFVNRQRYEYSKYQSNRPSTMNEKRLKDLQDLDFVFVAGKKMDHVDYKNKKSWEERYEELMQFRETYGHAIVPQSYPGLGEWVHSQRLYYKKVKAGKKSPLTNDRILKLADAGFVFDATKRRGNHVNESTPTGDSLMQPSPAIAAPAVNLVIPTLPPMHNDDIPTTTMVTVMQEANQGDTNATFHI